MSFQNGDYTFDNLKDINTEGFNIDTPKVNNRIQFSLFLTQLFLEFGGNGYRKSGENHLDTIR